MSNDDTIRDKQSLYNDIFISYSRQNTDFAKELVKAMYERNHTEVWIDWEDIEYAEDWWEKIKSGIESADNFLFLLTPDSARSRVCYDEVEYAHKLDKRIIPILHRDVTEESDFQSIHPTISQHNWLPFRENDDFDDSMERLIKTIESDLPHVRMHTRLLTRAREWDSAGRSDDRILTVGDLREAQQWLRTADQQNKEPVPNDLHREFLRVSETVYRRRQRQLYAGLTVAILLGLMAIISFLQFQSAQRNLTLAEVRGTEARAEAENAETQAQIAFNSASTATVAQGQARIEANNAATQARAAFNSEGTAIFAQRRAVNSANEAATQAQIAFNNEATAIVAQRQANTEAQYAATQAQLALNSASTATVAQGQANIEAEYAATQAQIALNNEATAIIAQGEARAEANNAATQVFIAKNNAATAIVAQNAALVLAQTADALRATAEGDAIQRGETAVAALSTSERRGTQVQDNAALAVTQAARAEVQAERAERNASTATVAQGQAVNALATSEVSERRARAQSLAVSADQVLSGGNPDLAIALAIEAGQLNPNLTQSLRVLNQAAPLSVRLSVNGVLSSPTTPILERFADLSPNGRYLAVVGERVQLWDLQTLTPITDFDASAGSQARFSADGRYLSVSDFDTVTVWDVENNALVNQLPIDGILHSIAAHPNQPEILITIDETQVIRWDVLDAEAELIAPLPTGDFMIDWVRFSPLSERLLMFDEGENLTASWNIDQGTYRYQQYNADLRGTTQSLEFAWGSGYERVDFVNIWNLNSGRNVRTFNGVGYNFATDSVRAATFTPDGRSLLVYVVRNNRTENRSNALELWDITTNRSVRQFRMNDSSWFITAMAYSNDGRYFLTGGNFGQIDAVILWDAATGEEIRRYKGHLASITHVAFSDDDRLALSRSADGDVRVWDVESANTGTAIAGRDLGISSDLVYARASNTIYANQGNAIAEINATTGTLRGDTATYTGGHTAIAFSPVDAYAALRVQGSMAMWDINLGGVVNIFGSAGLPLFSNDGQLLYVFLPPDADSEADTCCTYTVQTWDASNRERPVLLGDTAFNLPGEITSAPTDWMQLHPDGRSIAIATSSGTDEIALGRIYTIARYDLISGQLLQQYDGVISNLSAIRFSPDGTRIVAAIGSPQNALIVWDVASGDRLRTFIGHEAPVETVAFSPNGRFVVSGSITGIIKLWDAETGQLIRDYDEDLVTVDSIAFAPDSATFAVSGGGLFAVLQVETLSDVVTWIRSNRFVPDLSCNQRAQYGVFPLCQVEETVIGTPLQVTVTSVATETPVQLLATQPMRPTATPSPTVEVRDEPPRINSPRNVILRSSPNPNAGTVAGVSVDTPITILEETPEQPVNAFWYPGYSYIELPDGTRGWLGNDLIFFPENRVGLRWRLQSDDDVNIFQNNFQNGLLARQESGTEVEVLGYQASASPNDTIDMAQVRLPDGRIGWVKRIYLVGG